MSRHDALGKPSLTREEIVEAVEEIGSLRSRSTVLTFLVVLSLGGNLLLGGLMLFSKGAGPKGGDAVEAKRFAIRDADGKVKFELGLNGAGLPNLMLHGNKKGSIRLGFQDEKEDDYANVELSDGKGIKRVYMIAAPLGARLAVTHETGYPDIRLSSMNGGTTELKVTRGERGPSITSMVLTDDLAHLRLTDKKDRIVEEWIHDPTGQVPPRP